jgi:hypothetical protein
MHSSRIELQHRPATPGDPAPAPPGEAPQPSPRPDPDDDPPPVRAPLTGDIDTVVNALLSRARRTDSPQ